MSLLGPDAACSPGRVRRRRPAWTGPTAYSLRGRRHPPQMRHSHPAATNRGRRAYRLGRCHRLSRPRRGRVTTSTQRAGHSGGEPRASSDRSSGTPRPIASSIAHANHRTPHCQPDNGSPISPVAGSSGPCSSRGGERHRAGRGSHLPQGGEHVVGADGRARSAQHHRQPACRRRTPWPRAPAPRRHCRRYDAFVIRSTLTVSRANPWLRVPTLTRGSGLGAGR